VTEEIPNDVGPSGGTASPFEVVDLERLNENQREELAAGEEDPFDAAGNTLRWRPKDRHVALRIGDGRLVASAGLVLGDLQVGDRASTPFVGLGGVFVTAAYRGRGLGARIIGEALRRAAELGPDLVLLFCHPDRAALYERRGFMTIDPPVLVKQPDGYVESPLLAMWRRLRGGTALPAGPVTVHSLPF
jgi:GNAT superfamily N-acetyltransferase